jgi:hypothetical protein
VCYLGGFDVIEFEAQCYQDLTSVDFRNTVEGRYKDAM